MNRLCDFLEVLYKKHLRQGRYDVIRLEAELFFGTIDPRTIESYIGRPSQLKRWSGHSMVRLNRQTGETAKFDYMNDRKIGAVQGLAQRYGFITIQKPKSHADPELWILHHELMNYSSDQTILESAFTEKPDASEIANPLPEHERLECSLVSKDNLFVCLIDDRPIPESVVEHPMARSLQRDANMNAETDIDGEKRERAIEDTNKYVQVSDNTILSKIDKNVEPQNNIKLTAEETAILYAKPSVTEEPDKAFMQARTRFSEEVKE